jgi:hypothetical protein
MVEIDGTTACGRWGENARMALDTFAMKPTRGIPHWLIHVMEVSELEHFAGRESGGYARDVEGVYLDFQRSIGTCFIDQYIPDNPLSMTSTGYDERTRRGATTGADEIVLDGMAIDSPEAVVEHMQQFTFPRLRHQIVTTDQGDAQTREGLIERERAVQDKFGADILKSPYDGFFAFPHFRYGEYGYINYFTAYSLYPEVMEKDFALQADLAAKANAIAAEAIREGDLPPVLRLDHDMADSRSTLVDIKSLDKIWLPHFARAIKPHLDAGIRLLWHCDGNLMQMVPRLIEAGIGGFQGFQYEDGMDYEKICRMTDRNGDPLMIWAGVSVTRTLPMGTPEDVVRELNWLVRHGPEVGFFLGASSSVAPGVKRENLETLFEGLRYYQKHGRN